MAGRRPLMELILATFQHPQLLEKLGGGEDKNN